MSICIMEWLIILDDSVDNICDHIWIYVEVSLNLGICICVLVLLVNLRIFIIIENIKIIGIRHEFCIAFGNVWVSIFCCVNLLPDQRFNALRCIV